MQRRRAALWSVAGHGAFIAVVTLLGTRAGLPSFESPLIVGELITATLEPAATPAATPLEPAAERAEEPAPAPAPTPEPQTTEPAPAPRALTPEPEPEPAAPEERTVEPAPLEPPPLERLAELQQPDVESVTELPEAPEPLVAEGLPAADAPAVVTEEPVRSLASHEQRAVRRRLSSWTGELDADAPGQTLAWRDAGQDYTAVLKQVPATDAMGMEQLLVELTTQRDGQRLVAQLRMNRIAFSNFAQFIDRWDPQVQIHDDLIDGRFHSNTEIRVSREHGVQPVFNGKVTVAAGDVRDDGVGFVNRRTMFPEGIETRVRRIVLPSRAAAFDDGAVPADRVRRIVRNSLLTFRADGTFESQFLEDGAAAEAGALGEEPFYIVADEGVDLHVRGTVNGKVLVYSPEHIVIVDDVRYSMNPWLQGADDYLGLVAERTVEIDGPEVTGPGDLTIHASIYARNRFAVRDYRSRSSGTLVVYGSVTAGSISATEPRYSTRIEFDDRLTTMRAPGFPLSNRYELDSFSGEWRVVDAP
jgi:hypothetical protein